MDNKTFIHVREQSEKQAVELIIDLLKTLHGKEFDGIQAMRYFIETWGINADFHVYTSLMDQMTLNGLAKCTQPWGYTRYQIL